MTENEQTTFDKISEIIADVAGVDRARISMASDLRRDLGIAGDDGDDLFAAIGDAFDVDWTGLDLAIHFGNEGFGLPLPWQLRNNAILYEPQPALVSDIVQAVDTGRWPGTSRVPRPRAKRATLYLLSIVQIAVGVGVIVAVVATLLVRLTG